MIKIQQLKHITFVIPSIDYGGTETQLINQINFLHHHGYKISLIVFAEIKALRDEISLPSDRILVLHKPFSYLSGTAAIKAATIITQVLKFLKSQKTEIVVANLPLSHFIMRLVKFCSIGTGVNFCLVHYHHSMQYEESPLDTNFKKIFNGFNSVMAKFSNEINVFVSRAVEKNICENLAIKKSF